MEDVGKKQRKEEVGKKQRKNQKRNYYRVQGDWKKEKGTKDAKTKKKP